MTHCISTEVFILSAFVNHSSRTSLFFSEF